MYKIIGTVMILLLVSFNCSDVKSQSKLSEQDYAEYIQRLLGGELEVSVTSGRVDLVTTTHAFEIERANKWKESIGQSIWYALNTNKKAGIILILEDKSDYKYLIQLTTALGYAGLTEKVDVYAFPNDFKELMENMN